MVKLPISVTCASLRLAYRAFGMGLWLTAALLSYSLAIIGLANSGPIDFLSDFSGRYGKRHPNFVSGGFTDALQQSRREFKLLFVYLHSPDHPDTPEFCKGTLCSEALSAFVNENFIAWGHSIRASEGIKISKSLKASRFPFCAVVMADTGQRISSLRQFQGPTTPEEMLTELQRIFEKHAPALDAQKHRKNTALREEQDATYRDELEADQEHERKKDQTQQESEVASEVALAKLCESLGPEPEKGPNVTQVLVRLPNGERKGRRFNCIAMLQSVYDFVDSSGCLEVGSYTLVNFFPHILYGQDKLSLTLEELGLQPQASLFVELVS